MDLLKKWWPTIAAMSVPVFMAILPQLQIAVKDHPVIAYIINAVGFVAAHLAQSPLQSKRSA